MKSRIFAGALAAAAALSPAFAGNAQLRYQMTSSGLDFDARAAIDYRPAAGAERLKIKAVDLPAGAYELMVDGVQVGTLTMTGGSRTKGSLELLASDGSLTFSPYGATFTIEQGGSLFLSGDFPLQSSFPLNALEVMQPFTSTGVDANAAGEASFRSKEGRVTFRVTVDKLAPGTYDVLVSGLLQGFVDVDGTGKGMLRFSTQPNDAGFDADDMLLAFDPSGQSIMVSSGGNALLTMIFPGSTGSFCTGTCDFDPEGLASLR